MGAAAYFQHVKEALATIFDGMAVTASHMIRKPYTIQYPDRIPVRVQDTLPFRYRGILDVDMEICTGCLACDRACPIDCIAIAIQKNAQTREIVISQFDIDLAKCMYCGLCSEPCPTGSIHHTTEFEGADYSLESLIRRFIAEPVVAYKPKKGPEPDPEVAKLLERGMTYVDEWAPPGSDKPPAAKTAGPAKAGAAPARAPIASPGSRTPAKPLTAAAAKPPAPATPAAETPDQASAAATSVDASTKAPPTAQANPLETPPQAPKDAATEAADEANQVPAAAPERAKTSPSS